MLQIISLVIYELTLCALTSELTLGIVGTVNAHYLCFPVISLTFFSPLRSSSICISSLKPKLLKTSIPGLFARAYLCCLCVSLCT